MDTMMETFDQPKRPKSGNRLPSIYVHFPFCESKCHYCDFFSLPSGRLDPKEQARVYRAIERELEIFGDTLETPLKTVFFGGGTPSLAPLEWIASLIEKLPINENTEFTIEANPSSVTPLRARAWRNLGINRVSLGLQALDNERLKWLGRIHSREQAICALECLFETGFANVSIDYIVGVPGQTSTAIRNEISELFSRFPKINHVSAYLLTLAHANPKHDELPNDEEQLVQLREVSATLSEQGLRQYEISNFAKDGARALHNENYWLGGGYLGVGPGAHSFHPDQWLRSKNYANLERYCPLVEAGQAPVECHETLSLEQRRLEYLMLRLRRSDGLDLDEYRELFGRDLHAEHKSMFDQLTKDGLCRLGSKLQLTTDGFFLCDYILSKIH